ncbi:alcohol dehydrogenase [Mycobacterium servetii]|uniref:Alcohol dehydrogenase n=1 Tax=Mycobacterium servetii TaxID=3237418 RepID=A0ABV4C4B5_9MYCO
MSLFDLNLYEKHSRGSLFGSSNPGSGIPRMLDLHRAGRLKLGELVTREYTLEEIDTGYADLHAGVNLRGLIRF